jgi:hypothetical protein
VSKDELLLHQVHWTKLTADGTASIVSLVLIWTGHRIVGLIVHFVTPAVASAVLLRTDTSPLRSTRRGRYVLEHMPPVAQAVRLVGDAIMTVGAWRRSGYLIITGLLIVIPGWSHGLIPSKPASLSAQR